MKRSGFTVLEFIVVIAVVLIMAAFLMPVFTDHHGENAPRATCQSQLKQVALGFKQYIQDYDERYPTASGGDAFATANTWVDVLQPYVKSQLIFQCPSAEGGSGSGSISYGYNAHMGSKSEMKMGSPSLTILNYEVNASNYASCGRGIGAVTTPIRHLEGSNFSFVDGHVKWFKPGRIRDDANDGTTSSFVVH